MTDTGTINQNLSEMELRIEWNDYPANPVVEPLVDGLIADPAVVGPEDSHDGSWHMFTCGGKSLITHLVSTDGLAWQPTEVYEWGGFSPNLVRHNGRYYLFYQQVLQRPESVYIVGRESRDLVTWSEEREIISPSLEWENLDMKPTVRNPSMVALPSGEWRLYYSGGVKVIPELGFEEPANIGVATAPDVWGPYTKNPTPILSGDVADKWRNIGAGAMKVYYLAEHKLFIGFNNGIYNDEEGHARSALHLLVSRDGLEWQSSSENPFLWPEPGWKSSLVYQACLVRHLGKWWLYYNSREGWRVGVERIGLAIGKEITR